MMAFQLREINKREHVDNLINKRKNENLLKLLYILIDKNVKPCIQVMKCLFIMSWCASYKHVYTRYNMINIHKVWLCNFIKIYTHHELFRCKNVIQNAAGLRQACVVTRIESTWRG